MYSQNSFFKGAKNLLLNLVFGISIILLLQSPALAQMSAGSQEYGIEAMRPVFAGACRNCPYGAIAEVVKKAMAPYGYDIQICYICNTTRGVRQVADGLVPPQPENPDPDGLPVPKAAPDFGSVNNLVLGLAYHGKPGRSDFDKEGPRHNLRLFTIVNYPNYTLIAATKESGITDLEQLRGRDKPLHLITSEISGHGPAVLAYYGLSIESIREAGGTVRDDDRRERDKYFDLIIFDGLLTNAPEQNVIYELTQKHDLVFLAMPEDLLEQVAKVPGYERQTLPVGILRGVDRDIQTVARGYYPIFGRADAPDDFVYTLVKALDEQSHLWMWAPIPLHYNPRIAWKNDMVDGIPLHPGAAKYAREKGYMK